MTSTSAGPTTCPAAWEAVHAFVREAVRRVPWVTCIVVGAVLEQGEIDRCEALAVSLGAELRVR
jgi:hypothetical protein